MKADPHDVLGVSRDATLDDIRRAYKRMARKHHPDLNPHRKDAAARFREVTQAYERLASGESVGPSPSPPPPRARPRPRQAPRRPKRAPYTDPGDAPTGTIFGEADFIVRAHIQGVKAMRVGGIVAAIVAGAYTVVANGGMSTIATILASLVVYVVAMFVRDLAMVPLSRFEPNSETQAFTSDLVPIFLAVAAALLAMSLLPGFEFSFPSVLSAVVGGMLTSYMIGRMWDDADRATSLGFGLVLGLPIGAAAAAGFAISFDFGHRGYSRSLGMPSADEVAAAVVGALVGGVIGGLIAMLIKARDR